jgi:GNAT superfamily N-acetyltransferase
MTLEIKEVKNRRDLKSFVQFPFKLYKDNPFWVPQLINDEINSLREDKNPAFEYCRARYWLALRDGKAVGRIAGIISQRHMEKWGQPYMRFSRIDFVDDPEVSAALLGVVEDWARVEGLKAVHGPLGFSNMDHSGMLVQGFDELATNATLYNYAYYPQHLEALGYGKEKDWVEFELYMPAEDNERIHKLSEMLQKRYGLRLLETDDKQVLLPYARELFELYNQAYRKLFGSTELTEKQIEAYIQQYIGFISPKFLPVVLDADGKMVAFGITIPSLSRALQKARGRLFPFGIFHLMRALKKNDRVDFYLIAIKEEWQGRGVNAILFSRLLKVFREFGIQVAESNPELEDNLAVQAQWERFDKRQHKRRRSFIKIF